MSRKGFLPFSTVFSTPSASFSILAAVFLEIASLRGAIYSSPRPDPALAFCFASRASTPLLLFLFISAAVTLCATCRNSLLMGPGLRPVILPMAVATSSMYSSKMLRRWAW